MFPAKGSTVQNLYLLVTAVSQNLEDDGLYSQDCTFSIANWFCNEMKHSTKRTEEIQK